MLRTAVTKVTYNWRGLSRRHPVAAFAGPGYAQKRESLATENRPEDMVDLKSVAPSIIVDIRYAGPHNFVGRPIPGYDADKCLVTRPAAEAVASVQNKLTAFGSRFWFMIVIVHREGSTTL